MRKHPIRAALLLALALPVACVAPGGGYGGYPGGYPYPEEGGMSSGERREAVASCTRHAQRVARPEGARDVDIDRLLSAQPRNGRIDVVAYYTIDYRDGRATAYAECRVDRSRWRVLSFRWDDARPPQPPGSDDAERARDRCRDEVRRSSYEFRRFTSVTPGSRYYAVEMDVRRSSTSFEAACSYERRTGRARLTRVTAENSGGDFVNSAVGLCRQEAKRRGLSVRKVLSAVPDRYGALVSLEVRRGSSTRQATCRARFDGRLDFDL